MRRRRPIVVRPRRGPGLLGTIARTAVIAGTATAVSKSVSGAMNASAQQSAAFQQAQIDAAVRQHMATQQATMTPQAPSDDLMAQLQRLAQMKQGGLLTEDEFAAAKAKLLAS